MGGITIDKWGPAAWGTLHAFAHTSPKELSDDEAERMAQFLHLFALQLPCPKCRKHFLNFLERRMNDESLRTREGVVRLLHDAHNEVNERTGKRVWTLEEHYTAYRRPKRARVSTIEVLGIATLLMLVIRCVQKKKMCAS